MLPAKEAADYLLGFIKTVKLPRKLKVCFSNCKENITHATFRDLGFVAKENGHFDVYSAGGLGRSPRMGVQVASNAAPDKILYYIKAMVNTFVSYGNYENRGKARTRFMQETLGTEGYIKAYQEKLSEVLEKENLDITVTLPEITKQGDGRVINSAIPFHPQTQLPWSSGFLSSCCRSSPVPESQQTSRRCQYQPLQSHSD